MWADVVIALSASMGREDRSSPITPPKFDRLIGVCFPKLEALASGNPAKQGGINLGLPLNYLFLPGTDHLQCPFMLSEIIVPTQEEVLGAQITFRFTMFALNSGHPLL